MLSSLELVNYRRFKQYQLTGLKRVNLLVGGNNSGKTAILEAVHLLASDGDLGVLARIARERGEMNYAEANAEEARRLVFPDISHFFHGHEFEAGSSFALRSTPGDRGIEFSIKNVAAPQVSVSAKDFGGVLAPFVLNLAIRGKRNGPDPVDSPLPVSVISEEGALPLGLPLPPARRAKRQNDEAPVQFVSTDSLERSTLGKLWDEVVIEGREKDVEDAMRIVEPTLSSVAFLSWDPTKRYERTVDIFVGFDGTQRRYPLGSHGEGMRRMLGLALALANSRNGTLLIDEIDTGLHYSIMGDTWLLVAEAAERYNIQVFATTHSFDCIRGLNWLCLLHPELGKEVSLQKIEPTLEQAVALDARNIRIAVAQDMEVR